MPTYEGKCGVCGDVRDYYQTVADCHITPICCDKPMQKVIFNAPAGYVENIFYQSPIDGRPITTKHARIEDLRRNNSRPWEGMEQETKVAQQRAKDEEKKQDAAIETAVVSAWNSLTHEKRKTLEAA